MDNLIGSYKAVEDLRISTTRSSFTFPKGAIVAVKQVDSERDKVLIEFGPGDIDWKHKRVLENFEQLD